MNLTGSILGIQTVAPLMSGRLDRQHQLRRRPTGHRPPPTPSANGASGASPGSRAGVGPRGIRVNMILPGYIETPMTASAPEAIRTAARRDAARPHRQSDEVARLVVFLISDDSAYICGAEIPVDGGQSGHGGTKSLLGRRARRELVIPPAFLDPPQPPSTRHPRGKP